MTEKQIIELVKEHFVEEWCEEDGHGWVEFSGKPDAFLKFASKLRQEVIDEIIMTLEKVPNPNANRAAINRIMCID